MVRFVRRSPFQSLPDFPTDPIYCHRSRRDVRCNGRDRCVGDDWLLGHAQEFWAANRW